LTGRAVILGGRKKKGKEKRLKNARKSSKGLRIDQIYNMKWNKK
jgi:hypothetical protein